MCEIKLLTLPFFSLFLRVHHTLLRVLLALHGLGLPDGHSVLATLASLLGLVAARLGLVTQHLGARIVGLLLVDVLHQDTLVLEDITLNLWRGKKDIS